MKRTIVAATEYTISPELYREHLLRGIYSRVARSLRLKKNGRSHVSRVARGERKSPRVERALQRELNRIEAKVSTYALKQQDQCERAA